MLPRPYVSDLVVLESTDSTNDEARRLSDRGSGEGTVVIAERQSRGRGRRGAAWHSPPGVGLYLSVLLRPVRPAAELPRWGIAAAVAGCLAVRDAGVTDAVVEWPNDIVCRGLKIGGILVEARSAGEIPLDLVIGTGFNVAHAAEDFPAELRGRAGSILMVLDGTSGDREALAGSYLRRLRGLTADLGAGVFEPVRRAFVALAPGASGSRVLVDPGGGTAPFEGTARGLDDAGALRVERSDGRMEIVRVTGSVAWLEA
ncbi:MAG: biotin--[acetyl-CoA-carboxylase] ligase [Acidobacteriia bacterium]|nr:biotin--[acetyl-CoA-carboxylase] ligase [Terriglobia bacterium]